MSMETMLFSLAARVMSLFCVCEERVVEVYFYILYLCSPEGIERGCDADIL